MAALVAGLLVLAFPAAAPGQSRTLGSPLTSAPNLGFGCETKPALTAQSFNGDFFLVPSGVGDCSWYQAGVLGSVDYSDPRTGSVPADGTITNVAIRTGPAPVAAMGIVIVRQIGGLTGLGTPTTACCAFVSETALPPLAPNAINRFPVNIPVERNIRGTSAVADYVGISALSNTGSLPLLQTGPINAFAYQNGSPDAGYFYPRMGAQENPGGGTRNNESVPNVEVLLQWTWTPAGGVPTPPEQPPQPPQNPPATPIAPVPPGTAQASARRALIQLACGANAACQGQLELLTRPASSITAAKPKLLGKTTYALAASESAEVKVKLNRKGKRLVRERKTVKASLRLTPTGGTPTVSELKLKR